MAKLFNRDLVLNAGGLEIRTRDPQSPDARPTLRVVFQVVRSRTKDPNTADLSIYNLKKSNRVALQEKEINTVLRAGYVDNISQIFGGQLQRGSSVRDGSDWITSIQSGDSTKAFKSSRISRSFSGPVNVEDVLEIVANELGVGLGNLKDKIAEGGVRAILSEFSNGFVAVGKTEKVLHRITKAMGYTFSIQDGQLQLLSPGETINPNPKEAILLSSSTGLIGSPEPGEKGIVKARSLMQPETLPGRKVKIESEEIDAFFRIDKVVFSGDTWASDWYSDLEMSPVT